MGLGQFSECGLVHSCSDSENGSTFTSTSNHHTHHHPVYWPQSVCASRVFQSEREVYHHRFACLYHGSVYCAITSMPDVLEVCQHARGSSRCSSRCPESLDIVPLCQMVAVPVSQDCTHGSVYLFEMMIFDCFTLSCDGLLAVFVTIYCFKSIVYLYSLLD